MLYAMVRDFCTRKFYWKLLSTEGRVRLIIDIICWFSLGFGITYLIQL